MRKGGDAGTADRSLGGQLAGRIGAPEILRPSDRAASGSRAHPGRAIRVLRAALHRSSPKSRRAASPGSLRSAGLRVSGRDAVPDDAWAIGARSSVVGCGLELSPRLVLPAVLLPDRYRDFLAAVSMTNRLRELRAERGWSQADLAERLDVSRQTVNAVETERYEPSLSLAFKIARLFEKRIETVFDDGGGRK
jgi:putative transcriptional regulator